MTEIIQSIISFLNNLLLEPFANITDSFTTTINTFIANMNIRHDITSFMGACISNFVPVPVAVALFTICAPIWALNLLIKSILRIKSFIPGMGGK